MKIESFMEDELDDNIHRRHLDDQSEDSSHTSQDYGDDDQVIESARSSTESAI